MAKIVRLTTLLDFGGQEKKYISFTEDKSRLKNIYIFAAIGYGGYAENLIRSRGFDVKVFNQNYSIRNLKNTWLLYKWFKKIKPDIVHTAAAEANFHGIIAAKLAGVPVVFAEEIGLPNHSNAARKIFKILYKSVRNVICVSRAVKEFLIDIGEIVEKKGVVVYNPVSYPAKSVRKLSEKFQIVYVGRLEKVKNVVLLIEALARIESLDNVEVTLVGDGRERNKIEELIAELNLKHQVKLVGFQKQPEAYVSQADLFVLPSLSEGFGIAVVEAMFLKIPCLCSRVGGIPEYIKEGVNGWLFDPLNINELTLKLNMIINMDNDKLKEIGLKAQDHALHNFTTANYINTLEDLYRTNLISTGNNEIV